MPTDCKALNYNDVQSPRGNTPLTCGGLHDNMSSIVELKRVPVEGKYKRSEIKMLGPLGSLKPYGSLPPTRVPRKGKKGGSKGKGKGKGKGQRGTGSIPLAPSYRETKQTFRSQYSVDSNHEYLGVLSYSNTGTVTTTTAAAGTVLAMIPLNPSMIKPGGALDLDTRSWTRFCFLDWKLAFEAGGGGSEQGVATAYYEDDYGALSHVLGLTNSERITRARSARYRCDFVMRGRADGKPQIFDFKLRTPMTPLIVDTSSAANDNLLYQGIVFILAGLNYAVGKEYGTLEQRWTIQTYSRKLNAPVTPSPYAAARYSGVPLVPFGTKLASTGNAPFEYSNYGGKGTLRYTGGFVQNNQSTTTFATETCPSSYWQMPTCSPIWKMTVRMASPDNGFYITADAGHDQIQKTRSWSSSPADAGGGWYESLGTFWFTVNKWAQEIVARYDDITLAMNTISTAGIVVAVTLENLADTYSRFFSVSDAFDLRKEMKREVKEEKRFEKKTDREPVSDPTSDDESVFIPRPPLTRDTSSCVDMRQVETHTSGGTKTSIKPLK